MHCFIGCRSAFMCFRLKFLHCGHSIIVSQVSLSIPGQNHLSWSLSFVWSQPKWPFSTCVCTASWCPSVLRTHSTCAVRSLALVQVRHSLPSSIAKLRARCLALRHERMSPSSPSVSASTTSLSHGSSLKCSHISAGTSASPMCMMSFTIPLWASQLGCTIQSVLSLPVLGPLASDHFQLIASAMMLETPGQCWISTMFLHVIDSSHLVWVVLCLLFSSTSHSAWQSVSISICDPYVRWSNSSKANFNVAKSRRKGPYRSSITDIHFEQKAIGCHTFVHFPVGSSVSNTCDRTPPNPFLLPSVTTLNILLSYCGVFRTGAEVTATFNVRKAFFCSSPQLSLMDFAWSALLYAPFHVFPPAFSFSTVTSLMRSESGCAIVAYPLM